MAVGALWSPKSEPKRALVKARLDKWRPVRPPRPMPVVPEDVMDKVDAAWGKGQWEIPRWTVSFLFFFFFFFFCVF
jgi:hypothetical protein